MDSELGLRGGQGFWQIAKGAEGTTWEQGLKVWGAWVSQGALSATG